MFDIIDQILDPKVKIKVIEISLASSISEPKVKSSKKSSNTKTFCSINEVFNRMEQGSGKLAII